tara:strand:+ start:277 stop:555 length:279 start_codon:yes stop_codon:yes gene_type:complete
LDGVLILFLPCSILVPDLVGLVLDLDLDDVDLGDVDLDDVDLDLDDVDLDDVDLDDVDLDLELELDLLNAIIIFKYSPRLTLPPLSFNMIGP